MHLNAIYLTKPMKPKMVKLIDNTNNNLYSGKLHPYHIHKLFSFTFSHPQCH